MVKKRMLLITALTLSLLFATGSAYAATVTFDGPAEVNQAAGTFNFDILISGFDASTLLLNLDFWQVSIDIFPQTNAIFTGGVGPTEPGYVFNGNSFAFDAVPQNSGYRLFMGDAATLGHSVDLGDAINALLAEVTVNIENAHPCEWYTVSVFVNDSFFADTQVTLEGVTGADYRFHVVPIPGAAWLLGAGLLGLLGIRRRKK